MWCLLYPRAQEFFQWNTTWFQNRKTGFPSQILIGSKLWRNSASSRGPRAWYRDEELSFWSQAFCLWTQASHLRWASLMAQMVKKSSCSTGDFSLIPGSGRSLEQRMATHSRFAIPFSSGPHWMDHQNVLHWEREWQTTSIFFPWKPHEQYEKAKW